MGAASVVSILAAELRERLAAGARIAEGSRIIAERIAANEGE